MRTSTVLVPAHVAIVIDRAGVRLAESPPQWWIDMTSPEVADEAESAVELPVRLSTRRTACRPGYGPCRRRHEHASARRAAA